MALALHSFNETIRKKINRTEAWLNSIADATLLDIVKLGARLDYVGGLVGTDLAAAQPTPFLALLLRLVELRLTEELALELVTQTQLKYLRILGIAFFRFAVKGDAVLVHTALDVGFGDFRRIRIREPAGTFVVRAMDEVCDMLLSEEGVFLGVPLPALMPRASVAVVTSELLQWPYAAPSTADVTEEPS